MDSAPKTMKAWVYRENKGGSPVSEVLHLEDDYKVPVPKKNEMLVKVKAVSLNPAGWVPMLVYPFTYFVSKPAVPELDYAGVVVADFGTFKAGDEVCGINTTWMKTSQGTLAQYTAVDPLVTVLKPRNISFAEASCLGVCGLTAYASLTHYGGLKMGDEKRVLINGGSASTGLYGIQIAKHFGAYVVSTGSPASTDLVKSLGADEIIDYRSVDLVSYLKEHYSDKPFDIIYDCIGNEKIYHASPAFLKPEGFYADIAVNPNIFGGIFSILSIVRSLLTNLLLPTWLGGTPRRYAFVQTPMKLQLALYSEVVKLAEEGKIKSIIDKTFDFEDAIKAYELQVSKRAKGKVVVMVE